MLLKSHIITDILKSQDFRFKMTMQQDKHGEADSIAQMEGNTNLPSQLLSLILKETLFSTHLKN